MSKCMLSEGASSNSQDDNAKLKRVTNGLIKSCDGATGSVCNHAMTSAFMREVCPDSLHSFHEVGEESVKASEELKKQDKSLIKQAYGVRGMPPGYEKAEKEEELIDAAKDLEQGQASAFNMPGEESILLQTGAGYDPGLQRACVASSPTAVVILVTCVHL